MVAQVLNMEGYLTTIRNEALVVREKMIWIFKHKQAAEMSLEHFPIMEEGIPAVFAFRFVEEFVSMMAEDLSEGRKGYVKYFINHFYKHHMEDVLIAYYKFMQRKDVKKMADVFMSKFDIKH